MRAEEMRDSRRASAQTQPQAQAQVQSEPQAQAQPQAQTQTQSQAQAQTQPQSQQTEENGAGIIHVDGMFIEAEPSGDGIVRVDGFFIPYGDVGAYTVQSPYNFGGGTMGAAYRLDRAPEPTVRAERNVRAEPAERAEPTRTRRVPSDAEQAVAVDEPREQIAESYTAEAEAVTDADESYATDIDYNARDAHYDLHHLEDEALLTDEIAGDYTFDDSVGEEEEYLRFLRAYDTPTVPVARRRRAEFDDTGMDYSLEVDNIEENEAVVSARFDYEIAEYRSDREMLGYTFTTDPYGNEVSVRRAAREVDRRLKKRTKAIRCEAEQSGRYYAAAQDRLQGNLRLRAKNRARIDSVVARIDFLITERSEINKQLLRLYAEAAERGEDGKIKKRVLKTARGAYRAQKPLAKKVLRMHAPLTLKDKIFALMNKKTAAYADIEEARRILRQKGCTGAHRRAMKRQIRDRKRDIHRYDADIRYFVKRAERHNDKRVADNKQLAWVIGTLVGAALVTAAVFAYGIFYLGWYGLIG